MDYKVFDTRKEAGQVAAADGAEPIRKAIAERGEANIIVATGASQFDVLAALIEQPDIDWHKVNGFHLDEYVGLSIHHPASFRKYLWERFVSQLPLPMKSFLFLDGEGDCKAMIECASEAIKQKPIDVAFVGIGENGHLAFNDPPADFDTEQPYLIVDLDEACRQQQVGEGWFKSMDEVPAQAMSMSCQQILKSQRIICSVPDERKAQAVANTIKGDVSNMVPATIMQRHAGTTIYLDKPAASKL